MNGQHKQTTRPTFGVYNRVDNIPQPWEVHLHEELQDRIEPTSEVYKIANELIQIPVKPLPCPLVSGNPDWLTDGNVSGLEFMDTWDAFLDILQNHGRVIKSEFTQILVEDRDITLPRAQSGSLIVTRITSINEVEEIFLWTWIFGTGQVIFKIMDKVRHDSWWYES